MPFSSTSGFSPRKYDEILAEIENREKILISPNINSTDATLLGQYNRVHSYLIALGEIVLQSATEAMDINTAEGIWLDKKAYDKGVVRQQESYTTTPFQVLTGTNGTTIPITFPLVSSVTGARFFLNTPVTLSVTACRDTTIGVTTVLDSTAYTITINSTPYTYTTGVGETQDDILNGLKGLIDADSLATWGATVNLVAGTIKVTSENVSLTLNVTVSTDLNIVSISSYGSVSAEEVGEMDIAANTVTTLGSSIPGFLSTYNEFVMLSGRLQETDEELRKRAIESDVITDAATLPAIRSSLRNLSGVSYVRILDESDGVLGGYEPIIIGGLDSEIAQQLWDSKPSSVPTIGNTQVVVDDEGQERTIRFTRPTAVNIAVKVTISLYDEETLPVGYQTLIKEAVAEYVNDLGIGVDVIPGRLFGPIYAATGGIGDITVAVQEITTPGDTPIFANWQSSKLPIGIREFATTTVTDVYLV